MHPSSDLNAVLRHLPKVDDVLATPAVSSLLERAPRWAVLKAVRGEIERLREELLATSSAIHGSPGVDPGMIAGRVETLLRSSLQPVLNATGVVLHTNLGRAPLSERAISRIEEVA